MKQLFTLGQALSAISGVLFCSVDELYAVYNFLTQDHLYTHQLPRAFRECEPILKKRYPELAALPFDQVTRDNWKEWLAKQEKQFGPTVLLETISSYSHVTIDPFLEAEKMIGAHKEKEAHIDSKQ